MLCHQSMVRKVVMLEESNRRKVFWEVTSKSVTIRPDQVETITVRLVDEQEEILQTENLTKGFVCAGENKINSYRRGTILVEDSLLKDQREKFGYET